MQRQISYLVAGGHWSRIRGHRSQTVGRHCCSKTNAAPSVTSRRKPQTASVCECRKQTNSRCYAAAACCSLSVFFPSACVMHTVLFSPLQQRRAHPDLQTLAKGELREQHSTQQSRNTSLVTPKSELTSCTHSDAKQFQCVSFVFIKIKVWRLKFVKKY